MSETPIDDGRTVSHASSDAKGVLREVDWRSLAPWTLIFRTFPMAAGPSLVVLGSVGVLLSWVVWSTGALTFGITGEVLSTNQSLQSVATTHGSPAAIAQSGPGIVGVMRYYWEPATQLVSMPAKHGLRIFAYLAWGLIGSIAIWSLIGGAISRIAIVRLGRDETVGLREAVQFVGKRFPAYFAPPFYPLGVLIPLALGGAIVGGLMRFDFGVALIGLVWGLGLLVILACALLIVGVWVSWPLMVVTISAEGSDSLDGLSRGFAYSFQRPLQYVFYLFVSLLFSALCWWIATLLASIVGDLAYWSVSWGAGSERVSDIRTLGFQPELIGWGPTQAVIPAEAVAADVAEVLPTDAESPEGETAGASGVLAFGRGALAFWDGAIQVLLNGFLFSLFWCLFSAVYLLLRQNVDETEWDELYLEDANWEQLPELDRPIEEQASNEAASASPLTSTEPATTEPSVEKSVEKSADESASSPEDPEPDDPVKDE